MFSVQVAHPSRVRAFARAWRPLSNWWRMVYLSICVKMQVFTHRVMCLPAFVLNIRLLRLPCAQIASAVSHFGIQPA